ncbi:MAG: glycine cleavage system protein H [Bacteroidota bacterium]
MDAFHYYDLFATKGIEYLITIVFFLSLIPLWMVLNGKVPAASKKAKAMAGALSLGRLTVPEGLFYNTDHTWAFLNTKGLARVGIDDFLRKAVGEVEVKPEVSPGQNIRKGDLMAQLICGDKTLNVFAPVSGKVMQHNNSAHIPSDQGNPYKNAWLMELKPENWLAETNSFVFAEKAHEWMKSEIERFRDFVSLTAQKYSPEPAMVALQDGGEPREHVMREMSDEAWDEFQDAFLKAKA